MRTFIFLKRENKKLVIVGMCQSDMYPSSKLIQGGEFYACQCVEVTEKCHIEID